MTVRFRDNGGFSILSIGVYVPPTMLQNTVPLQDVEGTVEVMEWLNGRTKDGSSVLVHQAFMSWARLYLDKKNVIVSYAMDVEGALNVASKHGFDPVYLIWWNENIGWYSSLTVPEYFAPIFGSGRISVFQAQNG